MTSVKLIAITHETASLNIRSTFHLNQKEKEAFITEIQAKFDIKGLLVLATCNRTEIYFETSNTSTQDILDYLLVFKNKSHKTDYLPYFTTYNDTKSTTKYLLEVISGLRSLVVGDMQIISQFKQAFLASQKVGLQGQILERMVQAVFKMHKRIQNETDFRKGSASTSYLALLAARQYFGKKELGTKKVLLIGAGEIIRDVAKYSAKFTFENLTITNRTKSKAVKIAENYNFQTTDWENLNQAVLDSDIIISGVSNQTNLIYATPELESFNDSKLFIDLGMPANIDENLDKKELFKVINIDQLTTKSEQVEVKRQNAIDTVKVIIEDEYVIFLKWLNKLPANRSLSKLKNHIQDLLAQEMTMHFGYLPEEERKKMVSRLSQQLIKQPAITLNKKSENTGLVEALETVFAL